MSHHRAARRGPERAKRWQRMVGLLTDPDFTNREIHERLGALRWLSDEATLTIQLLHQHTAIGGAQAQFPTLPSNEELMACSRGSRLAQPSVSGREYRSARRRTEGGPRSPR